MAGAVPVERPDVLHPGTLDRQFTGPSSRSEPVARYKIYFPSDHMGMGKHGECPVGIHSDARGRLYRPPI